MAIKISSRGGHKMIRTTAFSCLVFLAACIIFPGFAGGTQTVTAVRTGQAPQIDGSGEDAAWKSAQTITVKDKRLDVDITLKAVHTKDSVFFLVQYPDSTEDRLHKPWVWNREMELYELGSFREDTFQFKWSMADKEIDLSNYSDDDYTADIWYWKAERTDSSGYADDKTHTIGNAKEKKSQEMISKKGRKRYLLRKADEGTSSYAKQLATSYKGDVIHQYTSRKPAGSRADVRAKGNWKDGIWTIEFGRKLNTGHNDDVQFDPASGKKRQLGISIKSIYGEPFDDSKPNLYGQGRISETLYLVFQ